MQVVFDCGVHGNDHVRMLRRRCESGNGTWVRVISSLSFIYFGREAEDGV